MKYGKDFTIDAEVNVVKIFNDDNESKRNEFEQALVDAGIDGWLEYCDTKIHHEYVVDIYEIVNPEGEVTLSDEDVKKVITKLEGIQKEQ